MATHSEERKAEALSLYRVEGSKEASRRTRIPESTIRHWASKAGIRTKVIGRNHAAAEAAAAKAARIRQELRVELLAKAAEVLERVSQPHLERKVLADGTVVDVSHELPTAAAVREYAVATGILLDKFRLEMGESTDRTQVGVDVRVSNLSDEELAHETRRILRAVAS